MPRASTNSKSDSRFKSFTTSGLTDSAREIVNTRRSARQAIGAIRGTQPALGHPVTLFLPRGKLGLASQAQHGSCPSRILVSSELQELLRCCDRILVHEGVQVGIVYVSSTSQQELLNLATRHVDNHI